MTHKPQSLFLLGEGAYRKIYDDKTVSAISSLTNQLGHCSKAVDIIENKDHYKEVEIIFGGWGTPHFNQELLDALPKLRACFYGAGSVRRIVSESFWNRGILLTSAYLANAVPVSEYTVATIILALKQAWSKRRCLVSGKDKNAVVVHGVWPTSKVGIIALGAIGKLVCEKLSHYGLDIFAYDPYACDKLFIECSATRVQTLEELFTTCNVVSLHAPLLPQTKGMITGDLLRLLPQWSSFINTARGAIVDEAAMIEVLREREDIFAIIDVISDESTYYSTELNLLQNVFLTPHIAGSLAGECFRMGTYALDECRRYLVGLPPIVPVAKDTVEIMA